LSELAQQAANDANFQRGEITLVVRGSEEVPGTVDSQLLKRAVELLAKELRRAGSVNCGAIDRRIPERAYELLKIREP